MYGDFCRYGFPKMPSKETIIAKPFHDMDPDEKFALLMEFENDEAKFLKASKETLSFVKQLLEDLEELDDLSTLTWDEFLSVIGV